MLSEAKVIGILFGTYGQSNDLNRQKIYCDVLASIPVELLSKAVQKVILEWKYGTVPPPAVIVEASRSLYMSAKPEARQKTWEEAWSEINSAMYSTQSGKTPKWSTPEIAAAVNAFGWQNLVAALADEMGTVRAQIRRFYEDACARTCENAHNRFLWGGNAKGILGVSQEDKSPQKRFGCVSEAIEGLGKTLKMGGG